MGLHPSKILIGYEKANDAVQKLLQSEVSFTVKDVRNVKEVEKCLTASVGSKLLDYSSYFCKLITDACVKCTPKVQSNFDCDHVRVCKIPGGNPL
jgi:T-complex protein 1 subunit theta